LLRHGTARQGGGLPWRKSVNAMFIPHPSSLICQRFEAVLIVIRECRRTLAWLFVLGKPALPILKMVGYAPDMLGDGVFLIVALFSE
jgi:hypothetical protein